MRYRISYIVLAAASAALAGCALSTAELQRESARSIRPTPYPDSVAISDVHGNRASSHARWVATTRTGVYDCMADPSPSGTDTRPPICARRDSAP